ncbi:hypothetical protein [Oryza sativa Japonica Group]|uniref:Uncharacterized protein n=2 Tax=Oryza sativa subsp. japonica TaxID=39947 RepID=Q5SNK1_ORYSJ|nr:hypothetical protein [Oryza sativa Japonica Group]BAD72418.1 hypothetical protein [Oryza sativa Japonica Group]
MARQASIAIATPSSFLPCSRPQQATIPTEARSSPVFAARHLFHHYALSPLDREGRKEGRGYCCSSDVLLFSLPDLEENPTGDGCLVEDKEGHQIGSSNLAKEDLNGQRHLVIVEEEDFPPHGKSVVLDPNTGE